MTGELTAAVGRGVKGGEILRSLPRTVEIYGKYEIYGPKYGDLFTHAEFGFDQPLVNASKIVNNRKNIL